MTTFKNAAPAICGRPHRRSQVARTNVLALQLSAGCNTDLGC
ncbi:hypothetical protein [Pectobacterium polaris]|nr:hypothetical protein [Pectobacterium polaris]